jgi:hypothetical protein
MKPQGLMKDTWGRLPHMIWFQNRGFTVVPTGFMAFYHVYHGKKMEKVYSKKY